MGARGRKTKACKKVGPATELERDFRRRGEWWKTEPVRNWRQSVEDRSWLKRETQSEREIGAGVKKTDIGYMVK